MPVAGPAESRIEMSITSWAPLTSRSSSAPSETLAPPGRAAADWPLLSSAALLMAVAAGIHVAVIQEHAQEWLAAAWFFGFLAALELLLAFLILARPGALVAYAAICVNAGTVALWVVSRSTGLPIGPTPGVPEPLGLPDIASSLAEALVVVALVVWLGRPDAPWHPFRPARPEEEA